MARLCSDEIECKYNTFFCEIQIMSKKRVKNERFADFQDMNIDF